MPNGMRGFQRGNMFGEQTIKDFDSRESFVLGYVVGTILGDGCLHSGKMLNKWKTIRYNILLSVKDEQFRDFFSSCIKQIGLHPCVGTTYKGFYSAIITSKKLFQYVFDIKNSFEKIENFSTPMKIGFLKGFYDSEGCFFFDKKTTRISLTQKDEKRLLITKKMLKDFGINSNLRKIIGSGFKPNEIYFTLNIERKDDVYRFYKKLGFCLKRKQNKLKLFIRTGKCEKNIYQKKYQSGENNPNYGERKYPDIYYLFNYLSPKEICKQFHEYPKDVIYRYFQEFKRGDEMICKFL